ncbi:MAG: hypothetical protein JXA92_13490 [candidate division Zixibacteria bacterium]|nr:hypothetical protein [candidate division Zixibacteria bacterium]
MKISIFNVCLFLFCLALPLTSNAQIDCDCLKKYTLNEDFSNRVTLITLDTTTITGRLLKVDFERSILTVQTGIRSVAKITTIELDSLAAVKFYRRGRIEGEWMLAGFLGGALLGAGISAHGEKKGLSRNVQYLGGFVAGGLIGLMLGFILPPMLSSQTIECGSVGTGDI